MKPGNTDAFVSQGNEMQIIVSPNQLTLILTQMKTRRRGFKGRKSYGKRRGRRGGKKRSIRTYKMSRGGIKL